MRVCLNMIVRDEAAVIERCLASVRPHIDAWVIVDTGSVDDTPERVQRALQGLPGELHHRPWRDFAHNRNEALQLARGYGDWLLFIDADESLGCASGAVWPGLQSPAQMLETRFANLRYDRLALVDARQPSAWRGVLHEYLELDPPGPYPRVPGFWIDVTTEGARSRDPRKFHKDAALLQAALQREPGNARYQFYLAQSWRDAGEWAQARAAYRQRAAMGGWEEEVWYSRFEAARMDELLGEPAAQVIDAYLAAHDQRPQRAEPLVALASYLRGQQRWASARVFAERAAQLPLATDQLFVDAAAHGWRARDEWALACYYTGDRALAGRLWRALLEEQSLPAAERLRIEANLGFVDAGGSTPAQG